MTTLTPADVLDKRPAALRRLEVLTGRWSMEASFGEQPAMRGGETTFGWLDGGRFLIQRFTSPAPRAPSGMAVIGAVAETDLFTQRYYDSRGVERVYRMTLDGREWTLWREAPGFCQRYIATISPDGTSIAGEWQVSADGREWTRDFGLTYAKIG